MKLSELRSALEQIDSITIMQTNGIPVPAHFHITEMGMTTKHFLDCGGTERVERKANIQLWYSSDTDHRLTAEKLLGIIDKASPLFKGEDLEVEVEYQQDTIGRFGLQLDHGRLQLVRQLTDCLAKEKCGIEDGSLEKELETAGRQGPCSPGSGCC